MSKANKHIVFDWNSTLLDDLDFLHGSTNRLLASQGHPPVTLNFFQAHYDIPFRQLYHNLGLNDRQIQNLIEANNVAFHEHYEQLAHTAELRQGAKEVLQHAQSRGVGTYILSNHIEEPIRQQLRRLDIEHYFTEILAYVDRAAQQNRHMSKGDKLKHLRGLRKIEHHPTIIVGDSLEEIQIAQEQNLVSVAITGGCASEERLRALAPDYVIHSLHELMPILAERGFTA